MKPIINPWIVYFSNMLENISCILVIALIVLVVAIIMVAVFYMCDCDYDASEILSKVKKLIIATVSCAVLLAVIPSQKTVYTMLVLNQVTPDNIKLLGDTGKDVIDYITDEIGDILDKDE